MKKKIIIISVSVLVLLAAAFLLWKFVFSSTVPAGGDENTVTVSSVAGIAGIGTGLSSQTRFSGVVEAQKTIDVQKDADKKVSKLYVSQGDSVRKGDKLFKYDTDDIALKLEQCKLDVDNIENKIQTLYNQISDLEDERKKATDDEYLSYTLQIQSLELEVKTEEYNKTTKANEVTSIEKSLSNTTVKSEIDGVVKSVNSSGQSVNGQEAPYISILGTGNYRVKCTVSELGINSLSQGQKVLVRSRIDNELTWSGTVDTIDRDSLAQDSNQNGGMVYMGGGGNGEAAQTASKYNVYVVLDNYDGLILGQHVYTELDFGQTEKKEGIWLPSFYIVSDNGKSYIWVRGGDNKIEKRQVTLGEQDTEMDTYEIKEGIQATDFIAFPQENLKNGLPTIVGDYTGDPSTGNPGMSDPNAGMEPGKTDPDSGDVPAGGEEPIPEGEAGTIPEDGGQAVPEKDAIIPSDKIEGEGEPIGGAAAPAGAVA